jgi:hypothetical protein
MECDCRRDLDWWSDLLVFLIQNMATLYSSLLHTQTSVHSHVVIIRCLVAASNGGRSPSSGFRNCPWPQLPASHSNSSQRLNLNSSLSNSPTNQLSWLCPAYNISERTAQKTRLHYSCAIVVETRLFAKCYLVMVVVCLLISWSLPSSGSACHNIKLDLREIGWGDTNWIRLAKDSDQWRVLWTFHRL